MSPAKSRSCPIEGEKGKTRADLETSRFSSPVTSPGERLLPLWKPSRPGRGDRSRFSPNTS